VTILIVHDGAIEAIGAECPATAWLTHRLHRMSRASGDATSWTACRIWNSHTPQLQKYFRCTFL